MRNLPIRFCLAVCTGVAVLLGGAPSALADPGDIAIFRETTATDALTKAVTYTHDFDTTVRTVGATYGLSGTNVTLKEGGHYAVLYSSRFDDPGDDGNDRSEIQSFLRNNTAGTNLPVGWSQGYTRRQQDDFEAITAGGGIINVAANDVLQLRSLRTDNENDTIQREPNTANIQLIKLDDNWDYLRLSRTSNTGNIGGSWTDVNYNSPDEVDAGSFDYLGGGDVQLKEEGHYLVLANSYIRKPNNNTRTAYQQRLTLDDALVDGTLTTVYLRGNPDNDSCNDGAAAIGTIIETTSADQILRVQVRKETGTNSPILANRAALTVVKLPDDADYIRLDDSGTDDFNPDSPAALGWDSELELDSYSFGHSDSQITANVAGDYMFLTALYDDDDPNSRIKWWQRWRENGTDFKEWGQTGRYSRDTGNQANGNWSGIMLDLDAADYVEVVSQRLGNSGNLQAVEKGLQGVRLDHLFADTLTWNGTDPADWTSANWLDGPVAPSGEERHVVPSGTVQVTSDLSSTPALSLTMNGGEVEVQSAGTLDVLHFVAVNSGVLDVDGTLNAELVTVDGRLEGSGTVQSDTIIGSGGILAPGDSTGEIWLANNLVKIDGAIYNWEFNGFANDTAHVGGQLALPGEVGESWTLRLFDDGIFQTVLPDDELVLFTYGTLLDGSVGNWVLDGSNLDWRVDLSNAEIINDAADSQVVLTGMFAVVPEPATLLVWSLLAGLGIGLGWRRRRR